ncbi:hypothetical protein KM043_007308 [Ampulex compressa]|nr:hypothetical protein KM043_007308 [Ampulex compressa]
MRLALPRGDKSILGPSVRRATRQNLRGKAGLPARVSRSRRSIRMRPTDVARDAPSFSTVKGGAVTRQTGPNGNRADPGPARISAEEKPRAKARRLEGHWPPRREPRDEPRPATANPPNGGEDQKRPS